MKTKIFVATHKKYNYKPMQGYYPIQVGAALNTDRFGYLLDNEGINISNKNKNFCELTACYWIWKNEKTENVGLCHYRRYLSKKNSNDDTYYLSVQDIENDLTNYDVILPYPFTWKKFSCQEYYINEAGKEKDLEMVRKIISDRYPKYLQSYDSVLEGKSASYCNMIITSKRLFDNYCEWLFSILFDLEKITDLSEYTPAEARIFGYISELLLNVWVKQNNLKIKYYYLINTEELNYFEKINMKIKEKIKRIIFRGK